MNADGILSTKIGGGAVDTDLMMTYTRAEEMGMKAALIIMERYPDTGITFVPENVNALVTPGLTRDPITLPAVDRVIGGETLHLDNSNPDNTNPGLAAAAGEAGDHRLDGRPGRRYQSNRRVAADDVHELKMIRNVKCLISPRRHEGHEGLGNVLTPTFVLFVSFVVNCSLSNFAPFAIFAANPPIPERLES